VPDGPAALCKARPVPPTARSDRERLRVAVDATPLLATRTGVGRFCGGVLRSLAARGDVDVSAFAVTWRRRDRLPPVVPDGVEVRQRAMPARPLHMMWRHADIPPIEWFVGRADVVHGTNFIVPPSRRAARVVSVHDLTVLRFPELCDPATLGFPHMIRRAVAAGAWVHTDSRFVADEVTTAFAVDPDRVRTVYPGVATAPSATVAASALMAWPVDDRLPPGTKRYVLAVGTIEPRKDYPGLVRAFDAVAATHGDVALVIAGSEGWGATEFRAALEAAPSRDKVCTLGYTSDDELEVWLAGAEVLVFPSLYEGFGFPPLEAMAAGVPVVATAAGSVPEVVGDAAVVVAPRDLDALAGALVGLLGDPEARARLITEGRQRVEHFTWEACGDGMVSLYADAARAR
jgi:glycosyltransferase involved in cell wall biosynthesis